MTEPRKKKKKKKRKGPFKIYREGGWMLYFWHGMRFGTWLKLLARGRFDITLNCTPNILTVTLFTPVNSLLYYLSEAIYGRRARRHRIDPPPIFVIGHWRSGTTLLHSLLVSDPAHGHATTYHCIFPSHFLLTRPAIGRWLNVFLPKRRPMDNVQVSAEGAREDELALTMLGLGSVYATFAWPRHGPLDTAYLDLVSLDARAREAWEQGFLWFIRRLSMEQKKRLVLKSPQHTARIQTLLKLFPDARFVHICRDPHNVMPSTIKTWKALNSVQGLHNPAHDDPWLQEFVFDAFETLFRRYEADRKLIPEGQLVEIAFEDLVADPKTVLAEVYAKLDLGDFARAEPGIDAYLAAARNYQPNVHTLPDDLRQRIETRCGPYMARFGYNESTAEAPASDRQSATAK